MAYQGFRKDWALSPEQKNDAREALTILKDSGFSLVDAARFRMAGKKAMRSIPFSQAVDEFKRGLLRAEVRSATFDWYESKFQRPIRFFGNRPFDEISRAEVIKFFAELELSKGYRAAIARALRALWNWGIKHDPQMATEDATRGQDTKSQTNGGDAEYLTVSQVGKVMANAGHYRNALAMLFFSGIRPEELAGRGKNRMLWKHVRIDEKYIRVTGEISKTVKPRIVDGLPETLWAWLKPSEDDDPISVGLTRQATEKAKQILGLKRWPHDGTRHTFATYALAFSGDAGKVSNWLGHEGKPTLLHQTYRGLTTKAEAEKFFALRPV